MLSPARSRLSRLFARPVRVIGSRGMAASPHPGEAQAEGGGPTPGRLRGKVAVVSASTDGIGLAVARRLAQDGARVVLSSRRQANVDRAVKQLRAENLVVAGIPCNVGKSEDRRRLMEEAAKEFGGIDILVSNVGTNPVYQPILEATEENWDKVFGNNVKGTFFLCKEAVPYMEKRGGGAIVVTASITSYQAFEMIGLYSVSKTALLGMVRAMQPQLCSKNIRMNAIAPGLIKTAFSEAILQDKETVDAHMRDIPMKRVGTPEDCAGVVSFLVSEDARYVTGETVVTAGGWYSRL